MKKSSDETGESKLPVTPIKKVSADDTAIVAESPEKGESKNQRRKRERKEQNKLVGKQEKVVVKASADATPSKPAPVLLSKQTSKDGKIKSKNFNLFAQFSGTTP